MRTAGSFASESLPFGFWLVSPVLLAFFFLLRLGWSPAPAVAVGEAGRLVEELPADLDDDELPPVVPSLRVAFGLPLAAGFFGV